MTARPNMGVVIDFDNEAGVWYVADSIPSGVNVDSDNLTELFHKIAAQITDIFVEYDTWPSRTIRLVSENED